MDTSPNPFAGKTREPDREGQCPAHGRFTSRNLLGNIWSKCPKCNEEREAKDRAEQRQRDTREAEERHRKMLKGVRIPTRFLRCTFDNFTAETPEMNRALTTCRDFVENFDEYSRKGVVLILSGMPGTGKSHLAGAILQSLLRDGVRYVTCMDMIRALRDTWRSNSTLTETQLLDYFESLDLLVIDEVGMQYGTEGEQNHLFDVLDRRYREVKATVILTNQGRDGLQKFIGDRSFDRLRETSRWVIFDWPSYRPRARLEAA